MKKFVIIYLLSLFIDRECCRLKALAVARKPLQECEWMFQHRPDMHVNYRPSSPWSIYLALINNSILHHRGCKLFLSSLRSITQRSLHFKCKSPITSLHAVSEHFKETSHSIDWTNVKRPLVITSDDPQWYDLPSQITVRICSSIMETRLQIPVKINNIEIRKGFESFGLTFWILWMYDQFCSAWKISAR